MQRILITISFLLISYLCSSQSQPSKKPAKPQEKPPTQSEMDKMLEEAMKGMSPEEKAEMRKQYAEGQKMMKTMQQQGMIPPGPVENELKIPKKKSITLGKIPKLQTAAELNTYLQSLLKDCRLLIDKKTQADVDALFVKYQSKMNELGNIAPALFMKKKLNGSIYAAVKVALLYPQSILLQNNLAVILQYGGYAHKAIPILHFVNKQQTDPSLLNNLGQCYLSLGDTAQARQFFAACLRLNPEHVSAHTGTATILDAGGKQKEAAVHIKEALKYGYSEQAYHLAEKNKIKLDYSDYNKKLPEYFNAQKYKPTPSAREFKEMVLVSAQRTEFDEVVRKWSKKYDDYYKQNENKKSIETMDQLVTRYAGWYHGYAGTGGVMAIKARMRFNAALKEYQSFLQRTAKENSERLANVKRAHDVLTNKINNMYKTQSFESAEAECKQKIIYLNEYLTLTASQRDQHISNTVYKLYEFTNEIVYWSAFLMKPEEYKQFYLSFTSDFLKQIRGYDQYQQLYPTPENIFIQCKNIQPEEKRKEKKDSVEIPDADCPLKLELPVGAAKFKSDCESWEIEGGEGIVGSFEKNYKTGEITIFVGLGVEFYSKGGIAQVGGGVELEAKGGLFIKFGKDLSITDYGDKAEVGGSAAIGPIMTEAKITGILGMESGGKLETDIAGDKTLLWKTEQ
ncbi:MAG: tetratricopeptide repeat protein [Chitinophagaceae bacterium]|nr:tetratricopeptide repeat protein [Chitinophagaceae bacterium]